jgi:hypothetical protein
MSDEHMLPPPPHGKKDGKKGLGKGLVIGLVIAGVVLMALGGILGHAMDQVWKYPEATDDKYDGDNNGAVDSTSKAETLDIDQDNFETRRTWDRALENVGTFAYILGMVILILGLLLGGLACSDLPDVVRLGCVVAVGFMVFFWI